MKKALLGLVLVLVICTLPASAAGRLTVESETFCKVGELSSYMSYCFARVRNTGDKPIRVNAGIFEVFDSDGDTLTSSDNFSSYAVNLEPDEYTYVVFAEYDSGLLTRDAEDYMVTITGKSTTAKTTRYSSSCEIESIDYYGGLYSVEEMLIRISNDSDKIVFMPNYVFAILDNDDQILYAGTGYTHFGIDPGNTVIVIESLPDEFESYLAEHDAADYHIDVIACVDEYDYSW